MILPYNKTQRRILDLKFHTFVYSMLLDLGYDMTLLGMKYFYEMVIIGGSVAIGMRWKNSEITYKEINLKNLEETIADELKLKPSEIKTNLDYAFNNIDLKIAKKNFGLVFEQRYTDCFNPKLLQANELLHYLVDKIDLKYQIQTSRLSPLTEDWTQNSIELDNKQYLQDLKAVLEEQQKLSSYLMGSSLSQEIYKNVFLIQMYM